jgi:hypothetical protein
MGLDMYLYARRSKYQSSHKWWGGDEPKRFYPSELKEFENDILERNFSSVETKEDFQIGYWRKANAIHGWIVKNCANGEDNCQTILLSIKAMEKLLSLCVEVLKEHSKASELLPCEDGFFFGSQKYDEWYFEDIKYTKEIIGKAIAFVKAHQSDDYHESWSIVYQASW